MSAFENAMIGFAITIGAIVCALGLAYLVGELADVWFGIRKGK